MLWFVTNFMVWGTPNHKFWSQDLSISLKSERFQSLMRPFSILPPRTFSEIFLNRSRLTMLWFVTNFMVWGTPKQKTVQSDSSDFAKLAVFSKNGEPVLENLYDGLEYFSIYF